MIRSKCCDMKKSPSHQLAGQARPRLETLEDRTLPSILTVTSTADSGPGSLRAAIAAAQSQDTITFALPNPSTINLTSGSLTIMGGSNMLLNIIGPGPASLTIHGNNTFSDFNLNALVSLTGLTISGGRGASTGGGINSLGAVTLKNCVIAQNTASESGGGIAIVGGGSLTMSNSIVRGNSACTGGGIFSDGSGVSSITNSLIANNQASATATFTLGQGGGIDFADGTLTLQNMTISGNAVAGVADNPSFTAKGGGIEAGSGGPLTVIDSTIDSNTVLGGAGSISTDGASAFGGGINEDVGTVSLIDSTISNNSAVGGNSGTGTAGHASGGGICVTGGVFTAVNSTIAGNLATGGSSPFGTANGGFGGGMLWVSVSTINITNCTALYNNVQSGSSGVSVIPSSAGDIDANGGTVYNTLIGDLGGQFTTESSNVVGQVAFATGPLANNGGPTKTIALLDVSGDVAIHGGNIAFVTSATDQRGYQRIVNGTVDVGAYEFQPIHFLVTAPGLGMAPEIKVYDATTGALHLDFMAYESTFRGGVRVAVADMDRDGIPDIITVPGGVKVTLVNVNGVLLPSFDFSAGRAPEVKVFSGADGHLLDDFLAYDTSFKAGLFVAAANIIGGSGADIIVAPDATGQSGHTNVRVFFHSHLINTGAGLTPDREFNAYAPGFGGGVRLAAGDINADGRPDIITAPGIWSGPDVRVFDGNALTAGTAPEIIEEFLAYDFRYFGGVFVAAGDVNGDGWTDIVTGTNGNGGPEVRAFGGRTLQGNPAPTIIDDFFAYAPAFNGGSSVAVVDVNGDGKADIVTGAGPGGGPHVRIFDGGSGQQLTSGPVDSFMAYDLFFTGGVFVGGA